jgi:peptidoglycan/xylan/chitin deacetylase (PgdA/CDA1 family)
MLAACTSLPFTAPEHDEDVLGKPLPYQPPAQEYAAPPPVTPITPRIVEHGSRKIRVVALTFDACATEKPGGYDERITQVLLDMKVPATIFLGGKWMEDQPEQTRYLASIPQFELGNHTFLHPHMTDLSPERMREELRWTQEVMYSLTGRQATLFRAPYGEINRKVVAVAAEFGLTTIQYDIASGDPDKRATKKRLENYVTDMAKGGSIVVMHINGRGWHTAEALPKIIFRLRKRGYTFVTVSELLAMQGRPAAPGR